MSEQALIELLYGTGAHANALACIEDIEFEVSGRRITDFPHTIWQLVSHMNFWMAYELKRIGHEAPVYPAHASESWPMDARASSEQQWQEAIVLFRDLLAELAKLAELPAEILAQGVDATHPDHTKRSSSLLAVLWQILVHNSYHLGQLVMLRRIFDVWPPKEGGDSW